MNTYYDGSYTIYQLNTIGNVYVSNFLKSNGELDSSYSYLNILDGSYNVSDLCNNNFQINEFKFQPSTNYHITDLSGIYDISSILNADFNMNTYYDGSYTILQLNTIGNIDVSNFLKSNGDLDSSYSYLNILDGSYSVIDLYNNDISSSKFSNSVYSIGDLSGIYSQIDILKVGYPANHYNDYNFSAYQLKYIGNYDISFFMDTSYSTQDIFDLDYPVIDLSSSGFLVQDTIDEYAKARSNDDGSLNYTSFDISGFFEPHILLRGYTYIQLTVDGFDDIDLSGFTPGVLKHELDIPASALKATDYLLNTSNLYKNDDGSLNYSIAELSVSGAYTNIDFINAINNSSPSFTLNDLSGIFQYNDLGTFNTYGEYNTSESGIALEKFKENNFDVSYLTNVPRKSTLIIQEDFRDKLFQLYYTAQNLYDGGFSIIQVSLAGGVIYVIQDDNTSGTKIQYDLSEVMLIKPPIEDLKEALTDINDWDTRTQLGDSPKHNININTLFQYNYSLNDVYNVKNNKDSGYSILQIKNAGYTIQEFYDNDITLTIAMVLIFSLEDILAAGYSIDAVRSIQSSKIESIDLLGLGAKICEMNTFKVPNRTWSRYQNEPIDLSNYSFNDYNMRRKAETLQYKKNSLEYTTKSNNKNILKGQNVCPISNKPSPSSHSDVPGKMDLYLDANVPLLNFVKKYSYDNNK